MRQAQSVGIISETTCMEAEQGAWLLRVNEAARRLGPCRVSTPSAAADDDAAVSGFPC